MKLCGLTQTYASRNLELDTTLNNIPKINLMNCLDGFRLNFHNATTFEEYSSLFSNKIVNTSVYEFVGVPYGYTIYTTLHQLKKQGFTDIVFVQDDHYFINYTNVDKTITDVIQFYKSNNYPIVYFGCRFGKNDFAVKQIPTQDNIYDIYNSTKFPTNYYPYDDSPYIANIDFLLKYLYTKNIVHMNVWDLEIKNTNLFKNTEFIFSCGTKPCSYCANFSGRNVSNAMSVEQKLEYISGKVIDHPECRQFYSSLS